MSEHVCHARGCDTAVSPSLLMCGKHWRMVPRRLRSEVWYHYHAGQEVTKSPSKEYLRAAARAIEYVYAKENHLPLPA